MTRRALLLALPALLTRPVRAQARRLVMLGDARQRAVVTTGAGGDLLGASTVWVMGDGDRLLREAGLARGGIDLGLLPHHLVTPRLAELFLPLDDAPADIPPALRQAFTVGGRLHGMPFAQTTAGLFRNEALLVEPGAPATAEGLLAACRTGTGTRPDGTAVSGLVLDGIGVAPVMDFLRLWDGDVLSPALALRVTEPAVLRGLEALAALFRDGVLPRTLPRFSAAEALALMQQGRGAFAIAPFERYRALVRPGASRDGADIAVSPLPGEAGEAAPVTVAVQALVIPRNAPDPQGAMRALWRLAGVEEAVRAGLNGNGPARLSALADPRYMQAVPWAASEAAALRVARPALPGFAQASRAEGIIRAEVEAMLVRPRAPSETVERLAFRLRPLLA